MNQVSSIGIGPGNSIKAPEAISVLIADGLSLFAESLAMALWWSDDLAVLPELPTTGAGAVEIAAGSKPDVALVDYWMPEIDGPAVAASLCEKAPATKVIMLSWVHGVQEINTALRAGAVGFLTKSVKVDQVAEAVRRAHGGEAPVFHQELKDLALSLQNRADRVVEMRRRLATLSPREMTVLGLLGRGLSTADIAGQLGIAPHTVSLHIHNLIRKSEADTKEQALAMARYCGMVKHS